MELVYTMVNWSFLLSELILFRDLEKLNTSIITEKGPQLFIGDLGLTGNINALDFLLHDNEETYNMGPVHYAAEAKRCAITKNNFKDNEQQIFSDDLELTLFLADVETDGSFNNLKAFPYNEVGYASGFGTLNEAGNILYFSSNRPGGYGGFDIYVSYFKNDAWTYPENLGPKINTSGNEVTPFFDGEQLYYSSDYLKGLGGLDVFRSHVYEGNWQSPNNMGNGINSPEDDFYFVKHPEKESYYITSNRMGGKGSYDIYQINKADITEEPIIELSYEEVVPAEVNLDQDLVSNTGDELQVQTVKLEEESVIENKDEIIEDAIGINDASISDEVIEEDTDSEMIDFNAILPPKAVDLNMSNSKVISLAGAKRVAFNEVITSNTNVYFIQLAALFKSTGNIDVFSSLKQIW